MCINQLTYQPLSVTPFKFKNLNYHNQLCIILALQPLVTVSGDSLQLGKNSAIHTSAYGVLNKTYHVTKQVEISEVRRTQPVVPTSLKLTFSKCISLKLCVRIAKIITSSHGQSTICMCKHTPDRQVSLLLIPVCTKYVLKVIILVYCRVLSQ